MTDSIRLTIDMSPDGAIQVNGPIGNKTLCYGMLEAAKDAIRDYIAANSSVITPITKLSVVGPNGKIS